MKIHYKKKTQRIQLILGFAWLILAILQLSIRDTANWLGYGWLILALLSFAQYYQQTKPKFLLIENGVLKENWLFGKSIKLEDIHSVKHFAGEYILKTKHKQLNIIIGRIENDSLIKLDEKLKSLDVKWNL